ncbi:MAG: tetratricopeptide repeat protein [Bacillota bacterium]
MNRRDIVSINTDSIKKRINDMGIKRSYIARKVGVSEKSVSRWTTGKITNISIYNAKALADCLECSLDNILKDEQTELLHENIPDDDKVVDKLLSDNLLLLLSPSQSWELTETIIKSALNPKVNRDKLGRLYNWLSITKWRTGRYEDAEVYAQKAMTIGSKIGNKAIVAKALYNLGTIYSISSRIHEAMKLLLESHEMREHFDDINDYAALCNNISALYSDMGYPEKSLSYQMEAIKIYDKNSRYYNLAIAYQSYGQLMLDLKCYDEAMKAADKIRKYSTISNYRQGILAASIYEVYAMLSGGCKGKIPADADTSVEAFVMEQVDDFYCSKYAAVYYRYRHKYKEAEKVLDDGIERNRQNKAALAMLYHEKSLLYRELGDTAKAKEYLDTGNKLYQEVGLGNRCIERV